MRIMQPRIGVAIVSASLLATGATSTMFAAQAHAQAPTCYSTCPPVVDLHETFRVLSYGSEEIETFSVRVRSGVIGAETKPTGTVEIRVGSTVVCTIVLADGDGSCSPSDDALPPGDDAVVAYYLGDSNYAPSQSRPDVVDVVGGVGQGNGHHHHHHGHHHGHFPGGFGFPGGFSFLSFLYYLFFGGNGLQTASAVGAPHSGTGL